MRAKRFEMPGQQLTLPAMCPFPWRILRKLRLSDRAYVGQLLHGETKQIVITQRPANISIKIDTTKEFAGDEKQDYDDLAKTEVGPFRILVCWSMVLTLVCVDRPRAPLLRASRWNTRPLDLDIWRIVEGQVNPLRASCYVTVIPCT